MIFQPLRQRDARERARALAVRAHLVERREERVGGDLRRFVASRRRLRRLRAEFHAKPLAVIRPRRAPRRHVPVPVGNRSSPNLRVVPDRVPGRLVRDVVELRREVPALSAPKPERLASSRVRRPPSRRDQHARRVRRGLAAPPRQRLRRRALRLLQHRAEHPLLLRRAADQFALGSLSVVAREFASCDVRRFGCPSRLPRRAFELHLLRGLRRTHERDERSAKHARAPRRRPPVRLSTRPVCVSLVLLRLFLFFLFFLRARLIRRGRRRSHHAFRRGVLPRLCRRRKQLVVDHHRVTVQIVPELTHAPPHRRRPLDAPGPRPRVSLVGSSLDVAGSIPVRGVVCIVIRVLLLLLVVVVVVVASFPARTTGILSVVRRLFKLRFPRRRRRRRRASVGVALARVHRAVAGEPVRDRRVFARSRRRTRR